MSELSEKSCVPCAEGARPLEGKALESLQDELGGGWSVMDGHHLEKEYKFRDFTEALAFTNRIGHVAETEGHHPDIALSWGKVGVTIYTHKIDGLTESDFVLAAKFDEVKG